jgi:hypothetical protein
MLVNDRKGEIHMAVDLAVLVETKATARTVSVNFKDVPLNAAGQGTTSVEDGAQNILQWGIVGDPGTEYKITLQPAQGKLEIGGQHPIDLSIPKGFLQAAGNRRFRVLAGGA